jgi:hypothetical protein
MQAALQDLTKQRTVPNVFIGASRRVPACASVTRADAWTCACVQAASTSAATTVRRHTPPLCQLLTALVYRHALTHCACVRCVCSHTSAEQRQEARPDAAGGGCAVKRRVQLGTQAMAGGAARRGTPHAHVRHLLAGRPWPSNLCDDYAALRCDAVCGHCLPDASRGCSACAPRC